MRAAAGTASLRVCRVQQPRRRRVSWAEGACTEYSAAVKGVAAARWKARPLARTLAGMMQAGRARPPGSAEPQAPDELVPGYAAACSSFAPASYSSTPATAWITDAMRTAL